MSLTLLAPVSLAKAAEQLVRQGLRVPVLEALLASATLAVDDRSLDETLAEMLGIRADGPPPAAALALATEGAPYERDAYWLCADPVSTTLLIDNASVDARVNDLTHAEADRLVGSINDEFAGDGLRFIAPDPSRWYVRCAAEQRVSTTPLWRAIGGSMRESLPAGADGPRWRARMNESQMLLHAHPLNGERESHGRTRVDSLWWWGGGRWPDFGAAQVEQVVGGPRWVRAACGANGVTFDQTSAAPHGWMRDGKGSVLCILRDDWESNSTGAQCLVEWDGRWFQPLCTALMDGKLSAATVLFDWEHGLLKVECKPPQRSRWQRWLGLQAPMATPSLEESLGTLLR